METSNKNFLSYQMKLSLALKQRKIYLYDNVDEDSIFDCLYYLNKIIEIDNISGKKEPIEILINSNGGYVYDGLTLVSLIEQMKSSGYEVITTNLGRAFSMGFIISICGTKRRAYKYSYYMAHDIATMCYGKLQTIEEDVTQTKELRNALYEIITKYTDITIEQLNEWHERKIDKFFNAEDALKLRITDEVM